MVFRVMHYHGFLMKFLCVVQKPKATKQGSLKSLKEIVASILEPFVQFVTIFISCKNQCHFWALFSGGQQGGFAVVLLLNYNFLCVCAPIENSSGLLACVHLCEEECSSEKDFGFTYYCNKGYLHSSIKKPKVQLFGTCWFSSFTVF